MAKIPTETATKKGVDEKEFAEKLKKLTVFIGEQVKETRLRLNLSQAELAMRADTSGNQVFLIEMGRQNMTIKSLLTLAMVLEIEPCDLFPKPQSTAERSDTKHVLASIQESCGRAKQELERIEGLADTLRSLDPRRRT